MAFRLPTRQDLLNVAERFQQRTVGAGAPLIPPGGDAKTAVHGIVVKHPTGESEGFVRRFFQPHNQLVGISAAIACVAVGLAGAPAVLIGCVGLGTGALAMWVRDTKVVCKSDPADGATVEHVTSQTMLFYALITGTASAAGAAARFATNELLKDEKPEALHAALALVCAGMALEYVPGLLTSKAAANYGKYLPMAGLVSSTDDYSLANGLGTVVAYRATPSGFQRRGPLFLTLACCIKYSMPLMASLGTAGVALHLGTYGDKHLASYAAVMNQVMVTAWVRDFLDVAFSEMFLNKSAKTTVQLPHNLRVEVDHYLDEARLYAQGLGMDVEEAALFTEALERRILDAAWEVANVSRAQNGVVCAVIQTISVAPIKLISPHEGTFVDFLPVILAASMFEAIKERSLIDLQVKNSDDRDRPLQLRNPKYLSPSLGQFLTNVEKVARGVQRSPDGKRIDKARSLKESLGTNTNVRVVGAGVAAAFAAYSKVLEAGDPVASYALLLAATGLWPIITEHRTPLCDVLLWYQEQAHKFESDEKLASSTAAAQATAIDRNAHTGTPDDEVQVDLQEGTEESADADDYVIPLEDRII